MAQKKQQKITKLEELVVSTTTCALFFGVSQSYVRQWGEAGCPKLARGLWNLYEVKEWYNENIDVKPDSTGSLREYQIKHLVEKIRVERVKADALEEKTLPRTEIAKEWGWRCGMFKSGILALASRLPPLLKGRTQLEMRGILTDEGSKLLSGLIRDHKFCPIEAIPEEYLNLEKDLKKKPCKSKAKKPKAKKAKKPAKRKKVAKKSGGGKKKSASSGRQKS